MALAGCASILPPASFAVLKSVLVGFFEGDRRIPLDAAMRGLGYDGASFDEIFYVSP